ncbi:50S ribosomal protein L11 methyltransferase [Ulvibacter litoralis]|uniref:Ribosomal protein L11 methyltransferase n=1 Tax=Ulvibacter litoralis TaxID=227084 RepID=A0A1G7GMI1_9FLAO|nr:50S ribosomal protein L11 methyltransferase [Ulvibacter litoralis]GHC55677.1 ribosomal protein L11 methyltransferase [Ulvibacter litoralis]SDE89263.1 ribosomal protein L11 methyltransferase [Ulvibacter litoralis]
MSQIYIGYEFTVTPLQPGTEILIAELGYAGFESFVETEEGVTAYIQKDEWNEAILEEIQILSSEEFAITHTFSEIEQVNWNAEWEKNFDSIEVDGTCIVRAPFHPESDVKYEIVIEPKMSFGTGHHETTFMMIQHVLENDFEGKTVLDMGCGTAVLAILAEMRGASKLDAIDIDPWCFENSEENVARNNCKNITVGLGDAALLKGNQYDIVIANINRNILLNDMAMYRSCLTEGGSLYLSGFYKEDLPIITDCCNKLGFTFVDNKEKNNWIAAKFVI